MSYCAMCGEASRSTEKSLLCVYFSRSECGAVILVTTRHTSLYFDTAVQHMASCCVGTSCSCLPEAVIESWSQSASAPTITAEPRSRPEVGPGRGRDHEKPPRSTIHCEDTGHWPPAHCQWLLYDAMTMPQSGEQGNVAISLYHHL